MLLPQCVCPLQEGEGMFHSLEVTEVGGRRKCQRQWQALPSMRQWRGWGQVWQGGEAVEVLLCESARGRKNSVA